MEHPYLYFSKKDIENFKIKIGYDAGAKKRYDDAVSGAEEMLAEAFVTEDYANGRDSLHGNFWSPGGQTSKMARCLGTKYLVEGDIRCAEKLKQLLFHYISFARWYAESYTKRTPIPWHSDLCSTGMTLAVCTAFDIIYDILTEEERAQLADGIYRLGVLPALGDWALPESRIHAVDSMGHNWWAVCIGEAATGLLALQDCLPREECRRLLHTADEALSAFFTYPGNRLFNKIRNFDDAGLFYESIGYFEYGVATPLRYLWCSERYFGENRILRTALPENMGDALMSFSYPYTKDGATKFAFLNFGDSGFWDSRVFLARQLIRNGMGTAALRACSAAGDTDLWEEIGGYAPTTEDATVQSMPKTAFFPSGYAVTRDTWEPDGTVFAVKSGFCWNHSHNDSGTFTLVRNGRPFLLDCGCCDYDNSLYHDYYCQDEAHNVLRLSGKGRRHEELYRGTRFPGSLCGRYQTGDLLYVQADCTGPMAHLCSRMYRNFFWFDNRLLVIVDDIYSHEPETVEFLLHHAGTCTRDGNDYLLLDGDNRAVLRSHLPAGMTASIRMGHDDHKPDTDMPYLVLSTRTAQRTNLLIHSVSLNDNNHPAAFSLLHGENTEGLCITDESCTREILYNTMADGHIMHDNSNNVIAGYDTDAYMLVITRDADSASERVLVIGGSYLRKGRTVLFSSFTKTTIQIKIC